MAHNRQPETKPLREKVREAEEQNQKFTEENKRLINCTNKIREISSALRSGDYGRVLSQIKNAPFLAAYFIVNDAIHPSTSGNRSLFYNNMIETALTRLAQTENPDSQTQLSNLLITLLQQPKALDEELFYQIANHITDFTQVNYFHDLVKFQNSDLLFFLLEKTKKNYFTQINTKNHGKTPLNIAYEKSLSEKGNELFQYLLGLGAKADENFIPELIKIYKIGVEYFHDRTVIKVNLDDLRSKDFPLNTFKLKFQLYNIIWIDQPIFDNLLNKHKNSNHPIFLPDHQIYLIQNADEISLSYIDQGTHLIIPPPLNNLSNRLKELIALFSLVSNLFKSRYPQFLQIENPLNEMNKLFNTLKNIILFKVKQDQKNRNLPVNFNYINIPFLIDLTTSPSLDMNWNFVDLRGAIFEKSWICNDACVPSLVGVQLNLKTLKNNGFFIQENPEGLFGVRFENDSYTKKLKNKFISDYLAYFKNETDIYRLLKTLHLFSQDTQHIVRLNQDKNKTLFGDTTSFKTILREGQTRLHTLSQESGFRWDSTNANAQQQLNDIFKTNYTEIKNPMNDIMQIRVSNPDNSSDSLASAMKNLLWSTPAPTTTAGPAPNINSLNAENDSSSDSLSSEEEARLGL